MTLTNRDLQQLPSEMLALLIRDASAELHRRLSPKAEGHTAEGHTHDPDRSPDSGGWHPDRDPHHDPDDEQPGFASDHRPKWRTELGIDGADELPEGLQPWEVDEAWRDDAASGDQRELLAKLIRSTSPDKSKKAEQALNQPGLTKGQASDVISAILD